MDKRKNKRQRIKEKKEQIKNKKLCRRYPFLIPRNRWTGKIIWKVPEFETKKYEYTELDAMPTGWRTAFGEQMCEEIRKELIKNNCLNKYYIMQIKEKFGELRWYDLGGPAEVEKIIDKYSKLSERTCICCGRPATKISMGWISPYCDKCAEALAKKTRGRYHWTFRELEFTDEI